MSGRRIGDGAQALSPELVNWQLRDPAASPSVTAVEPPAEDFARAAHRRTRHAPLGRGGLRKALAEFVIPRISEPQILSSDRRLVLLQDLLPRLERNSAGHALAAAVIRDEIARQRHLLSLLQKGIAA